MIPFGDNLRRRLISPANLSLVLANIAVFGLELRAGAGARRMVWEFGFIPAHLTAAGSGSVSELARQTITLLTSQFLHAGVLHILGNLLYLVIFGPGVEGQLGAVRYFFFYLCAGVVAGLTTLLIEPQLGIPVVGASGAIAGTLGAYFIFFPRARVKTLLPLLFVVHVVEVPAVVYLFAWFVWQLYGGLGGAKGNAVAWWSHVGGFLFGMVTGPFLRRRQSARRTSHRR